jgi:pimeloyl-ACP methyl ester carboxylesterase
LLASAFDSAAATAGVRLLALDRPGFGHSDPWPARSITDAGRFVTAVLDDAGVHTAALVAFSGGSQHAVATAATHGDRVSTVDIVSGATPPGVSEDTPTLQRVLGALATRASPLLRGLFRGQAWLAARRDPSLVVSQYRADDPAIPLDDEMAAIVKADFLEAFATSRRGAVTEFRNTETDWGVDFDTLDVPITLWHGGDDTNVPIADARRFETALPEATLRVNEDADHLGTLVESMPDILERAGN